MRIALVSASAIALLGFRSSESRTAITATVEIKTFQFAPDTLRIQAGTRVTWMNRDEIEHTVTAGAPDARATTFDKALGGKGSTYEVAFDHPGTFGYFCDRHQFMRGTIIVTR